jgi:hypothetical protein
MTYERSAIRKWFMLGGNTCPLTGVRLTTTKVDILFLMVMLFPWVSTRFHTMHACPCTCGQ